MANTLMNSGREGFATAAINWPTDTIKCVAVDAGYTFSAAHDFLDDVDAGARVATTTLTNCVAPGGVLDADDATFTTPPAGDTITGFFIYKDTGVEATSRLIYWIDTVNGTAVSVATNDEDITLTWNASGIVKI